MAQNNRPRGNLVVRSIASPERALLASLIVQALHDDLVPEERASVADFFASADFVGICAWLDLSPEAVCSRRGQVIKRRGGRERKWASRSERNLGHGQRCADCGKVIGNEATRCGPCAQKERRRLWRSGLRLR